MNNMKKIYQTPAIHVMVMDNDSQMLLSSGYPAGTGGSDNPGHSAARPYSGGWDNEDY